MTQRIYVGEIELPPGWIGPLIHTWTGVSTISSPTSFFYKGTSDESSTILGGSNTSSGGTQTSKTITIPNDGTYEGAICTLAWSAVYEGKTDYRWLRITVPKKETRG